MSNHSRDGHQDGHGNTPELVESSGIKAKPILIFLAALAVATAMVFVIIKGMQYGFKKMDEADKTQPATQLTGGEKLPPAPRLQGAPEPVPNQTGGTRPSQLPLDDLKTYREQVNEKAGSYEWVDKQGNIARIPIERAKEMIAEKGLPSLSETAIKEMQTAEAVRKEVYNSDSNAGRGLKIQKPASAPQMNAAPPAAGNQPVAGEAQKPAAKAATGAKH